MNPAIRLYKNVFMLLYSKKMWVYVDGLTESGFDSEIGSEIDSGFDSKTGMDFGSEMSSDSGSESGSESGSGFLSKKLPEN